MTNRFRKGVLPFAIAALLAAPSVVMAQNVTSSAVTGVVVNAKGQPVAGATVQIVHVPSGTTKVVTTNASGRYNAKGLRVGGPYAVTASKAGMVQSERSGLYLQLGQASSINLVMKSNAASVQKLADVTVTANELTRIFSPENKGIGTNISSRELEMTPTPGRSIADIARLDPRVVVTDRSEGKISAMGQNFRYNNITIDSVGANDPFGLNPNGLATTGTPISQDTIAEYNISVANYDVSNRRGLGANINAVTKSGTNHFHGSVYYVFQNADMIGDKVDGEDSKFAGFDRKWTGGATVGGPIIKDKLFFFASYEKSMQIGKGSSAYGPEGSGTVGVVRGLTQQDLQDIRDAAAKHGLTNIGDYTGGNSDLSDKRYLVKLDWNITNNHRASLTWRRTKEFQPFPEGGSEDGLVLSSNWHVSAVDNQSYALHLYDDWSDNFSSATTLSYAHYHKDSGPFGGVYMPDITVSTHGYKSPSVEFGTSYSYQANHIDTKTLYGSWAGTWYAGDHTFKFGFDYERDKKYNIFLQDYMGSYDFDTIDDFKNGDYYSFQYKQPMNGMSLDQVAAKFTLEQWGLFLQDTWQVNYNLSVQYGFRIDIPSTGDKPLSNSEYAKAGFTTPTGEVMKTNQYVVDERVVQPRLSFNYSFDTERSMQLRGGFGLFLTNPPAVWIGNIYSNTGVNIASYKCVPTSYNDACNGHDPQFSPDPYNQDPSNELAKLPAGGTPDVSTLDPNFHLPSAWKYSLAYDAELPWWHMVATVAYEHIDNRDAIWYQALNIGKPTGTLPDGRNTYYNQPTERPSTKYDNVADQYARARADDDFSNAIINLANTSGGQADNLTLMLKKPFQNNWSASLGVTWNHATDVNPGTSSVAMSSYKQQFITNPNENKASISNYNTALRVIASLSWRHAFFGHYYTSVSAFYDGHTGHPYSWAFYNDANGDSFYNDLAYIPNKGDVILGHWDHPKGQPATFVPASKERKSQFYDFIQHHKYLREHQGQIAARNGARAPWINQLDVSFSQEIPGLFKGNKGVIRLDIFNFLNLLNSHWGIERRAAFPGKRYLASYGGVDAASGKYIYDISGSTFSDKNGNYTPGSLPIYDDSYGTGDLIQRWSVQLTLRYKF